jgi:hypothetical protein
MTRRIGVNQPVTFAAPNGSAYIFDSMKEACLYFDINRSTVRMRILAGWTLYDAYTKPIRLSCRSRFQGDRGPNWVPRHGRKDPPPPATSKKGWGYK